MERNKQSGALQYWLAINNDYPDHCPPYRPADIPLGLDYHLCSADYRYRCGYLYPDQKREKSKEVKTGAQVSVNGDLSFIKEIQ